MTSRPHTESPAGHRLPSSDLVGAPVVVGFDDGAASVAAVQWAAVEAARLGSGLTVLSATDPPVQTPIGIGAIAPAPDLGSVSRAMAARGVHLARSCDRELAVGAVAVVGGPAGELVARSSETGLVVVGRSRRSALQTAVLGSVSFAVAAHARCPVVVVREGANRHPGPSLPVVVGVDGSRGALAAVSLALAFARVWQAPLRIVGAYPSPSLSPYPDTFQEALLTTASEQPWALAARAAVDEAVRQAREREPAVHVTGVAEPGRAEDVLVDAARDAGLVVVGSRGHGGFAGLMLGSVSHGVMRRSASPVVVVRRGSV
ncbi:universal stress protein [Pedococcus sp. P5_B7]